MPNYLSPIGNEPIVDANGAPLAGGKIYTYLAGTSTPAATYTSSAGATPQANPIILNARGVPDNPIWLAAGVAMKLVVKDASDVALSPTYDDVVGINDPSSGAAPDQWVSLASSPTYIAGNSFSVSGDKTPTLQVGRRLKTTNAGGTVYGTILTSSFGAGITTVTVSNDAGALDAGLSEVSYGIISPVSTSAPEQTRLTFFITGGISTAYTLTPAPACTIYAPGVNFMVNFHATCGAAPTINISGLGAIQLVKLNPDGTYTNLEAGDVLVSHKSRVTLVTASTALVETLRPYRVIQGSPTVLAGASFDITGIPSWAKRITVALNGASFAGAANPFFQVGDSGGLESAGYTSTAAVGANGAAWSTATGATGWSVNLADAAAALTGVATLTLLDAASNVWVFTFQGMSGSSIFLTSGSKATSGTLDRLRFWSSTGVDTFDAGSVSYTIEG
jgi:hypothetical protein